MANPFYVEPAGDYSSQLSGIGDVLRDIGEQRKLIEQENKMTGLKKEAERVLQTRDPDQIAAFGVANPEFADILWKAHGITNEADKAETVGLYRTILTGTDPAKALQSHISALRSKGKNYLADDLEDDYQLAQKKPDDYRAYAESFMVGAAPDEYKAYAATKQKAPEGFTLSPGETRYDAQGKPIASLAAAPGGVDGGDTVQSSQILPDGTAVIVNKSGATKVIGADGNELKGDERAAAIIKAQEYGAELQGLRAGERVAADIGQREGFKAFESLSKVYKNMGNLDAAIAAIDKGANTGVIANKFPSWNASTIELQNIASKLGLDVVGSVTFGALSEGELALAMSTALPTNLDEKDLRQWLVAKKEAQGKLADYLSEQATYLSKPGNNLSGWLEQGGGKNPNPAPGEDGWTDV